MDKLRDRLVEQAEGYTAGCDEYFDDSWVQRDRAERCVNAILAEINDAKYMIVPCPCHDSDTEYSVNCPIHGFDAIAIATFDGQQIEKKEAT